MKFYSCLPFNRYLYNNWTKTYCYELDHQINGLFDYINYFMPDFQQVSLEINEENNNTNTTISHINSAQLLYHQYYKASKNVYDDNLNIDIKAGTLIVSYAQSENDQDNQSAETRKDPKYYAIQPFGWASYYSVFASNGIIQNLYQKNAEETNGLKYEFSLELNNGRYLATSSYIHSVLNNVGDANSIILTAKTPNNEWNIYTYKINNLTSQNVLWTNISTNPLMHEIYYNNSSINEQIAMDCTWKTGTEVASTNIATYTITRAKDITWPNKTKLWLEVW